MEKSQVAFEDKVVARHLNQWNALIASLLAGLGQTGLLNQVTVNLVMGRVADFVIRYFKVKALEPPIDPTTTIEENFHHIVDFMQEQFSLAGKIEIEKLDGAFELRVHSDTCRFCPKGVGEAEVKGTLCPFPLLLQCIANAYLPVEQQVEVVRGPGRRVLVKEEGKCKIEYQRTAKAWKMR